MIEWIAVAAVAAALGVGIGRGLGLRRERRRVSTELDRARAERTDRLAEVYSLQELSLVLSESLRPERIAVRITEYVARFVPADGILVALSIERGTSLHVAAARGSLSGLAERRVTERDGGLVARAIREEQIELAEREDETSPVLVRGMAVERAVVLPLRAHGETAGALAVAAGIDRPFSSDHLRLLSTVATHAAIALSNARFVDLLRTARDQWETTFDSLADGIAVVDESGAIRRANRTLAQIAEREVSDLTGAFLAQALFGGSADLTAALEAARQGSPETPLTLHSEPLNRTLRVAAAPMRGEDATNWVVALVKDVTEDRALEEQLIQNEKMAAVGQLVSGVAHELNNPLTSIAGLAEFLLERAATDNAQRDHLRVIHEQADRAGRIVRNLLTFARKGPSDTGPLDVNDIVGRTTALVRYEIRLREVHLETRLDPDLPSVRGDRYQIQQVILNLVTNAVQAVAANPPDRPRRIEITTARDDAHVVVTVGDTGPGVPEEAAGQVFTPFFTTKEPGHGTGLGLSISFRIVHDHGGTLTVRPGTHEGAVFVVRLPVRAAPEPAPRSDAAATDRDDGAAAADAPAGRRRILLLEDDPAVRRMISVLLSSDTHTVETAQDGPDAVRLLEDGEFDLIVADPRAAVAAGERFAEHLLRRWPGSCGRIILVTADVRPETDAWLRELGCRYFLKPFRMGEFKAAAAEVLARRGGEAS